MGRLGLIMPVRVPLFTGQSMEVRTNECVSRALIAFGYAEPTITALMLHVLTAGQCFVDVGTHFGYEALLASKLVGSTGKVLAFEPHPKTAQVAKRNLTPYPQAELHQMALSSSSGSSYLQELGDAQSAFASLVKTPKNEQSIEIKTMTLDEALKSTSLSIHLLKIDVEGHERCVLEGAKETISKDLPIIVLESDMPKDGKSSKRTFELADCLNKYGYAPYSFNFDGDFRIGELDSFPIEHPNVLFLCGHHHDIIIKM